MRRESSTLEDLPPLELRPLRDLTLEEASQADRPPHVSSASGVVRRGDFVYVIGDDELSLGVFAFSDRAAPGHLRRALSGRLPVEKEARGEAKPDLEALTVLPPFAGHPFGSLLGLGSGSAPGRDRGFVWALAHDGSLRGEPRELDLAPVYALLREQVDALNVEGACAMGERLWLLHRGNHGDSGSVIAELALDRLLDSLGSDLRVDPHELADLRSYDLGELDGVSLAFSDATPIGGDVLVFTASAEARGEGGPDGAIRGSVVGTIDLDGRVQRLRTIDRRFKVEGVHATIDTGVLDFLFVCDQDDAAIPSPLLSATMPMRGELEREEGAA